MRVLVDTNIFLDVLLARPGLMEESGQVIEWCVNTPGAGWIAWHTLSNLSFIGTKLAGKPKTDTALDRILDTFEVAPVDTRWAIKARTYSFRDFEDALQSASAMAIQANGIVTRNVRDFRKSPIPALTPATFLSLVK